NYIPFKVTIDPTPAVELYAPVYPPGKMETYEQLGTLSVYTGRVVTYVPLQLKDDAKPGPLVLSGQVQYQMCNDKACFPPKLPTVFSAGITAVFAILGLLVVVLRWLDWGKLFGNVYFLVGIIVLLLLFALWQFGVLKFVLPPSIYDHMPQGETYLGNFLFGIF